MIYLYFGGLVVLLFILFTGVSAAPWVPTRKFDVDGLLDDAQIKPGDKFIELGCGDGRLVKAAAKRGAIATGYELNPLIYIVAVINNLGVPNSKVVFRNFWSVDLTKADIVMAFVLPRTLPRLDDKLDKELKPGAIFISYVFPVEGHKLLRRGKSWLVYRYKDISKPKPSKSKK